MTLNKMKAAIKRGGHGILITQEKLEQHDRKLLEGFAEWTKENPYRILLGKTWIKIRDSNLWAECNEDDVFGEFLAQREVG